MLGSDSGKHAQWNAAALAATLALTSAVSSASPPQTSAAETSRASESATWVPKVLSFSYHGVTTRYTCDALQTRMKALLLELGARPDLRVVTWGCTRQIAADILPGVTVQMNVLQPAPSGATPLAAHWQRVDLLANRSPSEAAGDCELISQIKLNVLPLFSVRNVDYSATCVPGQLHTGTTRLTAEVLVADAGSATASR
jgi:hypothetical protein